MIAARLWQWMRPALAGLLLLGLLVPTLDAFNCIADLAPEAGIAGLTHQATAQISQDDPAPPAGQPDADPLCPHGHCHHLLGVTRLAERTDFAPSTRIVEPTGGNYDSPPSAPRTELLRPPRA
jgi:hypothetical protein